MKHLKKAELYSQICNFYHARDTASLSEYSTYYLELFKDLDTRIDKQIILDYNLYDDPTSNSEFIDKNQVIDELNSCTQFVPLN